VVSEHSPAFFVLSQNKRRVCRWMIVHAFMIVSSFDRPRIVLVNSALIFAAKSVRVRWRYVASRISVRRHYGANKPPAAAAQARLDPANFIGRSVRTVLGHKIRNSSDSAGLRSRSFHFGGRLGRQSQQHGLVDAGAYQQRLI
jgi:hypothetical protein